MLNRTPEFKGELALISDQVVARLEEIAEAGGSPGPFSSAFLSQAVVLAAGLEGNAAVAAYLEDFAAKLRAMDGVAGNA